MVGVEGFEPAASWSQTMRATKLRQTPIKQEDTQPSQFIIISKNKGKRK